MCGYEIHRSSSLCVEGTAVLVHHASTLGTRSRPTTLQMLCALAGAGPDLRLRRQTQGVCMPCQLAQNYCPLQTEAGQRREGPFTLLGQDWKHRKPLDALLSLQ
jgi:hypothetical protein